MMEKFESEAKQNELLHTGLNQIDEMFPVYTPDLTWFTQQVEMTKKNVRRGLIRDLLIFWLIAISIIVFTFMLIHKVPILYFCLQIAVLLSFVFSLLLKKRKQVEH